MLCVLEEQPFVQVSKAILAFTLRPVMAGIVFSPLVECWFKAQHFQTQYNETLHVISSKYHLLIGLNAYLKIKYKDEELSLKGSVDVYEKFKASAKVRDERRPWIRHLVGSVWLIFVSGHFNRTVKASRGNGFKFHPHEHWDGAVSTRLSVVSIFVSILLFALICIGNFQ